MNSLAIKWYFSVTNLISVRDSLTVIKNLYLCTKFIKHQNYFSSEEIRLFFRTLAGVYMYFWICRCPSMQQSGLSLLLFFACFFTTSFHSFSTATFASGINIAWSERSFTHTLGFPRQASRRDRCPELSEPYVTLGSLIRTYYYCVHSFYLCVHPRLVEQNNIPSLYFFLPRFTLESISYSPGCRVTRRIVCHRYAVSRDETTCARFHLKNKKTKWRPFFRSFHRSEFVYQVVMLHRIPSFYCNINTNEFCFRHFGSCYFGTTVSRTHVREHCLLHGIAASRFLILVSFFLKLLSQILVNASVHIWSGRDDFLINLPPGWLYPFRGVSLHNVNLIKSSPWPWQISLLCAISRSA